MDGDDKICEQMSPGVLERIYPTEVIEQCVQASEQWIGTKRPRRSGLGGALSVPPDHTYNCSTRAKAAILGGKTDIMKRTKRTYAQAPLLA